MTKKVTQKSEVRTDQDDAAVVKKLNRYAQEVLDNSGTLALNGSLEPRARGLAEDLLKATDADKKRGLADKLAALIKGGNVAAKELAGEIVTLLQPELPGIAESATPAPAPAVEPGDENAPKDEPGEAPAASDDAGGVGAGKDGSDAPAVPPKAPVVITMPIKDIVMREPLSKLFIIRPDTLAAITQDMKKNGFDLSLPVTVWAETRDLVDGFTRIKAALELGIQEVPVCVRSFADEDQAIQYALHVQRDRRNLTDGEILNLVKVCDERRSRGGDRRSEEAKSNAAVDVNERSSAVTAKQIGTSSTTVEKVRAIIDSKDEALCAEVQSGNKSINKAATEARQAKRRARPVDAQKVINKVVAKVRKLLTGAIELMEEHSDSFGDLPDRVQALEAEVAEKVA